MLDDRNDTVTSHQFIRQGIWDRIRNETGWSALLGDRRATEDVSIYAAPARAANLSGLPRTYTDAGSAEVFRDEAVNYALRLWEAGVVTDLHIWAGGFHVFDGLAPNARVSIEARGLRNRWLGRVLEDA